MNAISYISELETELEKLIRDIEAKNNKETSMQVVYATLNPDDFEFNKEYYAFLEWDQKGKCTVHLYSDDEGAKAKNEEFHANNCKVYPLKHRVARVMFTAKQESTS